MMIRGVGYWERGGGLGFLTGSEHALPRLSAIDKIADLDLTLMVEKLPIKVSNACDNCLLWVVIGPTFRRESSPSSLTSALLVSS